MRTAVVIALVSFLAIVSGTVAQATGLCSNLFERDGKTCPTSVSVIDATLEDASNDGDRTGTIVADGVARFASQPVDTIACCWIDEWLD